MKILKIIMLLLFVNFAAYASNSSNGNFEAFVVEDIKLQGQKHVSLATVLSYLPIKRGEKVNAERIRNALSVLYGTGLFHDLVIFRDGNDLIVGVGERSAISEIVITGNKKLKDKQINEAFEDAGLVAGRIYNPTVLDAMRKELETAYYSVGRYSVKMESKVTRLSRQRVKIELEIKEGKQAKIRHVNIVGNQAFSDEELLKGLELGTPAWWALFSSKNRYEKGKLKSDLEAIESYYFDRGYLEFNIESTQVSISENKKDIFITVNVTEGDQYKISDIKYSGELVLATAQYEYLLNKSLSVGDVFSRKNSNQVVEDIQDVLGYVGYLYAEVDPVTEIDKANKTVVVNFNVNPKQKIYVNSITFKGNEKTLDKVYRRELRQIENAVYNSALVERSRVRIQRLEYVEEVEVEEEPALNRSDAVDIVYNIEERLAGSFNVGLGISDSGAIFSLGLAQSNLFGTGNALSLNLSQSDVITNYSVAYQNPYYKKDNMGRAIRFNFREYDTTDQQVATEFLLDTLDVGVTYSFPLSEYTSFSYGFSVGYNKVVPGFLVNLTDENGQLIQVSPVLQIQGFINENGAENDFLRLSLLHSTDKRDRRIFAKRGYLNQVGYNLTTPVSDVAYYKLNYLGEKYFYTDFGSLLLKARISYGDGIDGASELPFYEKFIAGGIRSLRGFDVRSIGPREIRIDGGGLRFGDTLGGDLSTIGTVEWLFHIPTNSAELGLFYDIGNVFENTDSYESSELRSSYGVKFNWLSPFGPLAFSYAIPVDSFDGDEIERFQFTVGNIF